MADNQTWILRQRPEGDVKEGDLELVTATLEPLRRALSRASSRCSSKRRRFAVPVRGSVPASSA